jgi:hypothetical protein
MLLQVMTLPTENHRDAVGAGLGLPPSMGGGPGLSNF